MNDEGFIRIYRSFLNWQWYSSYKEKDLYLHCILNANYQDKMYKGNLIKRGTFVTTYGKLQSVLGFSKQNVRTALSNLELTHHLTHTSSAKGLVITVVDYDKYYPLTQEVTRKVTHNQHITNNNTNKVNKVNNVVVSDDTPTTTTIFDDDFARFWKVYQKKGSKKDTYEVWKAHEFDEKEIDLVIFAAKEYSKENASDRTSMMYSRTFLENEIYLDYQDKFKKYKVYLQEQEDLEEVKKMLKTKDGYE